MSIFRKKDVGLAQTEMKRLGRSSPDYFGFDFSRLCGYVGYFLC